MWKKLFSAARRHSEPSYSIDGRVVRWANAHSNEFSRLSRAEAHWVLNGKLLHVSSAPKRDEIVALLKTNMAVVSMLHTAEGSDSLEHDLDIIGQKASLSLAIRNGISYDDASRSLMKAYSAGQS